MTTNGKVREHDFCCYYQHEFGQSCLLPDPFVLTVTYGPDTAPTPVTEDALAAALHRAEIDCWPDVDGCAASGHRGAAYRLRAAIPAPEPSSGAAPVEERCGVCDGPSGAAEHHHVPGYLGGHPFTPAPRSAGAGDGRADR